MTKVVSSVLSPVSKIISPFTNLLSLGQNQRTSDTATNYLTSGMQSAEDQLKPYADTGVQANTALQNQLSSGALGGNFTPGDLTKEPGYQFSLDQGQQALDRRAAAPGGGGYFSGQALKDAQKFGVGLADQTYNDAYNRWLNEQQNTYKILSGQQNVGANAALNIGRYATGQGVANANNSVNKNNLQNNAIGSLLGGFGG